MPEAEVSRLLEIDLDPELNSYQEKFNKLVSFFTRLNVSNYPEIKETAQKYKMCMLSLDPVVESFTSKVCPYCGTVCCRQKFALPNREDIILFWALNIELPDYDFSRDINSSCQFLSYTGCSIPRLYRPFRCTWYFCEALWVQIEIHPPSYNIEGALKQLRFFRDKVIKLVERLMFTLNV